jgi:hypothetical protein
LYARHGEWKIGATRSRNVIGPYASTERSLDLLVVLRLLGVATAERIAEVVPRCFALLALVAPANALDRAVMLLGALSVMEGFRVPGGVPPGRGQRKESS